MLDSSIQYAVMHWTLMLLAVIYFFRSNATESEFGRNNVCAIVLLIFMILIIGVREWRSPDFGDSYTYGMLLAKAKDPSAIDASRSIAWDYLNYYWNISGWSVEAFFLFTASVYCIPMYFASVKFSKPYSPYVFLLFFACSFGWYSFGVNGIRNGCAFALMIWALIAFYDRHTLFSLACLFFAWCIHGSSIIAIGGFIAAYYYHKPQKAFYIWIACVLVSLVVGRSVQEYFATIDFIDKDGGGYLMGNMEDAGIAFSHTGFRWDFLAFSVAPIIWGIFCNNRLISIGRDDVFYKFVLCSYIYANAVWVLAIRAAYSNRLAQVSWWMIPIIMAYPLLRMPIFKKRTHVAGALLLIYYSFTFFMYLRSAL